MRGEDLFLRAWLLAEFDFLRDRLEILYGILEMADRVPLAGEWEAIKYQVASISEGLQEVERRLDVLENHNSVVRWLVRQIGTVVFLAVLLYFLRVFFGFG